MESPDLKQTESKEIAFFDKYYENEAYNPVGWRLRLAREVQSLRKEMRGGTLGRVLSLGCGDGQFELMLAPWAQQVVGLDISPQGIEIAQRQAARQGIKNVEFRCLSFSDLKWDDKFDTIICLAFLHHVPESELPQLLKQCFNHLKPGGFFYSQDPNRNGVLRKVGRVLMGASYDRYHSPDERELDPCELEAQLKSAGFTAVDFRYIDFTLIPALFILAKKPSWPLRLCVPLDYLWCLSPLARWASGFVAVAEKSAATQTDAGKR
jgi:2-polyprenyl-6-hydroxyphenyl methylase/3-demethylubiquinone-9 3-methyltransferase